jgi:iron complex outermembrane receptor protein
LKAALRRLPRVAALAVLAGVAFASGRAAADEPGTIDLAIGRQPLAAALQALARQSGIQIIFFSKIADGHDAPAISGHVTIDYALHRLLAGTGLTYRRLGAGMIEILKSGRGKGNAGTAPPPADGAGRRAGPHGTPPPPPTWTRDGAAGPIAASGFEALHAVVVTGTRELNRTVATSLSPIDVLTPAALASTGAPDLATALRTLLPSFNFPQPSITDATDASQPAQLRGLSPDETLVLIDGKRLHTTAIVNVNDTIGRGSSPVDLSAIPLNAVDHIEVLRDGAAAQYGSDAIAGVINIILKHGPRGGSADFTTGQYVQGDGRTEQGGADGGMALGSRGWVRVSIDALAQQPTNRSGPDIRYPGDPTYGQRTFHYGLPALRSQQGAINLRYDFTPRVRLYAFSVLNHKNVWAGGYFRSLSQYAGTTPAAAEVYPAGFLPIEESTLYDDNEVLGLRGSLAGWHYDVSANAGGNTWRLDTADTFNYSLGGASPTDFHVGTLDSRATLVNADFKRAFSPRWLANGLLAAWGLEYRHERFTIGQGDPASFAGAGAQVYPGYTPGDAGAHARNSQAAYLDLESDLTRHLSAALAVRHEHYSDFGGTMSEELAGRYALDHAVAVRATASDGFRAPSLQQEYYSSTAINIVNGAIHSIRTFPVSDPAAIALGARPLKAEQSHSYTAGLVLTPPGGLYATLDLYQITIAHRIILSGDILGPAVQSYLTSAGIPFVDGGRFFTNAVDTRTRGVDLVSTYPWRLPGSRLNLTVGANYNKTEILAIAPNPPQAGLAGLTLPIITRDEQGRITVGSPRSKAFIAADWKRGQWTVHGQLTRYGQWTDQDVVSAGNDRTYGARLLLDAGVQYRLDRMSLAVGGDNITNTYPDRARATLDGILPYPETSPFGFEGAYYYGRVGYEW